MDVSIRNVVESIMGSDGPAEPGSPGGADDAGANDFGEIDDDQDGLGGLDGDDEFGGMDGDDEFGAMAGDDGGQIDELEHRIDEIETELDDLSSTVETVRTENEQISASVADVEENVRKLLDIYEMVTNGVNPFADDVDAGAAGGSMGGDFGLFDDDRGDGGSDDGVDENVAEADPEGFFDENLDEEDLSPDDEPAVDEVFGDEPMDAQAGASEPDTGDSGSQSTEGGTSFEDLKAEYDDGETGDSASERQMEREAPPDGTEAETARDTGTDHEQPPDNGESSPPSTSAQAPEAAGSPHQPLSEASNDASERIDGGRRTAEPEPTSAASADEPQDESDGDRQGTHSRQNGDLAGDEPHSRDDAPARSAKPYLTSVPGGYASDLVVTEWLESLVAKAGVRETAAALEYYESIGWLAPAARKHLEARLGGLDGDGNGTLDTEDHTQSLQYVSQINGCRGQAMGRQILTHGGSSDGVQR